MKKKKKSRGRGLMAVLVILLLIVAGVIVWRLREYKVGGDYYDSLRTLAGRLL